MQAVYQEERKKVHMQKNGLINERFLENKWKKIVYNNGLWTVTLVEQETQPRLAQDRK